MRRSFWLLAVVSLVACRPPGYGKGDDADDEPTVDAGATLDGTGDGDAPDGPPAAKCLKDFRLEGRSNASSVYLTGTFVSWAPDAGAGAVPFILGGDGAWTGSYEFEAGTHQYKFIVSGEWIADPGNPDGIDDGFGGRNSLYTCAP